MAHKVGKGASRNGRDSKPKFRGIKKYGGESVISGNIIVRQVGNRFHAGRNVAQGRDFTLYSMTAGTVEFQKSQRKVHVNPA